MFMAATIVATAWRWARGHREISFRLPFLLPLGLFIGWTMVAAFAAGDNPFSRHTLGKFYLLLLLVLVPVILRGAGRILWIYHATFATAAIAALAGVVQYIADPNRDLNHRITGFQSTWMNYAGQLMLVLVALCAYTFSRVIIKRPWVLPLGLLIAVPLAMSKTRNAWLGAAAGIGVIILFRRYLRLIAGMIALLVVLYMAAPQSYQHRLLSGLNPDDPNTANRIEVWQTSIRLIRAHPWVGVGQESVWEEALHYRGNRQYPDWLYQHMLNNFLQIAAERGIPGLLLWLWFMGRLAWDAFRVCRQSGAGEHQESGPPTEALMCSTAALGAWAALMAAGMFEYNFGSSVVMILFLFIAGAPYAFLNEPSAV
jgi:O-antigen ligase